MIRRQSLAAGDENIGRMDSSEKKRKHIEARREKGDAAALFSHLSLSRKAAAS
jgi:hypothetical protein